jgi:hypothetical protein
MNRIERPRLTITVRDPNSPVATVLSVDDGTNLARMQGWMSQSCYGWPSFRRPAQPKGQTIFSGHSSRDSSTAHSLRSHLLRMAIRKVAIPFQEFHIAIVTPALPIHSPNLR